MIKRDLFIPCGSIKLEALLEAPESPPGERLPTALILHPHPLYGGDMGNNVTSALAAGLNAHGVATMRFNFRGVGASGGRYGEGIDEIEDVLAAMSFLDTFENLDCSNLILAGYSFGCWVGLRAASLEKRPMMLIGVSPPVDMYDFGFLVDEKRPKLLMAGTTDFVCSSKNFLELASKVPDPKRIVTLEGTDHFHFGKENRVVSEVLLFLNL